MTTPAWNMLLQLDEARQWIAGDPAELRAAIARGADLRIYSEFRHNEHIDTSSTDDQWIEETMDMRTNYLVDKRWCGGILTLRQPVELPIGFGPRPSLSLFMYNEDGTQAVARPFLDGPPQPGQRGPSPSIGIPDMPKYHELDRFDDGTNAPSSNFSYDFATLKYFVRDDWTEVLAHSADGQATAGSPAALHEAFARGAEIKLGIADLCLDLSPERSASLPHEVFIQCGSCYYYTRSELLIAATHPLVRVAPAIPLRYASGNWDYTWLVARTDGHVAQLRYDPYTLLPHRTTTRHALRWFVR
jgi:hypothetical protein